MTVGLLEWLPGQTNLFQSIETTYNNKNRWNSKARKGFRFDE